MRKNLSVAILFLASLLMLSVQAFAQYQTRIDERVQQTVSRYNRVDLAQWLRISHRDVYTTELLNLSLSGQSFSDYGIIEILADGRIVGRMDFRRFNSRASFPIPYGITLDRVQLRVHGEVFVESIGAIIQDRRYAPPAPRPLPPRYEPPRPLPPRYEPAPRPTPRPPRYEPAPRPTPPRAPAPPRPGRPTPSQPPRR